MISATPGPVCQDDKCLIASRNRPAYLHTAQCVPQNRHKRLLDDTKIAGSLMKDSYQLILRPRLHLLQSRDDISQDLH